MIKALIIDDEQVAVNVLQMMLKRHIPDVCEIGTANSARDAIDIIPMFKPDIVFLDVEMPHQNGFELLKSLPKINFDVVFTTAYDRYAILAIRFSALDYLLKPIDVDELKECFARFLLKRRTAPDLQASVRNLISNLVTDDHREHRLALPTHGGMAFYYIKDIVRCEGKSNYTKFYFSNQPSLTTSRTIKEYEEILEPYHFVRTHKSHLVNASFVTGYNARDLYLVLKDDTHVDISRRRRREVLELLGLQ